MSEVETSTPEAQPEPNYGLLAKETFGSNYHGEVQAPEPIVEEPVEAPSEEPLEPVEAAEETGEVEDTEETTEAAEGEGSIRSLSELLESEGYDKDEFMSLEVDQKIDGETRKVKLSELIATNQTQAAVEKRLEEVKEKAKSQNQALAEKQQNLDQLFNLNTELLKEQKAAFDAQEKALETDPLRQQDPAEWAAKKAELADQRKLFDSKVMAHVQRYQQSKQQTESEKQAQQLERLQKEEAALLTALPEWSDEETKLKEQEELANYLVSQELPPESYQNVSYDHKLLIMARKALKYDQIQAKAEPAKKMLKKVPKTLKPGSKPSAVNTNQTEKDRLRKIISQNPNSQEAERAAVALLKL